MKSHIAIAVVLGLAAASVCPVAYAADPAPAVGDAAAKPAAPSETASRQITIQADRPSLNAFSGPLNMAFSSIGGPYAFEAEGKLLGRPGNSPSPAVPGEGGFGGAAPGAPGGFGAGAASGFPFVSLSYNGSPYSVTFTVDFTNAPGGYPLHGKAEAFADALGGIVQKHLLEQWNAVKQSLQDDLDAKTHDLDRADGRLHEAQMEAAQVRDRLRAMTARTDLSSSAIKSAIEQLEVERQKLELDVAGMKARREALDKAVAEQSDRAIAAAEKDPVAIELSRIVDIRQRQLEIVQSDPQTSHVQALQAQLEAAKAALDRTKELGESNPQVVLRKEDVARVQKLVDTASSPRPDSDPAVQAAVMALAEAKARLAERKLTAAGAGDALAAWNRQLLDLTIDLRERDARLATITEKLDHFSGSVEQAQKLEQLQQEQVQFSRKEQAARDAASQADEALSVYRQEPKVTVSKPQ